MIKTLVIFKNIDRFGKNHTAYYSIVGTAEIYNYCFIINIQYIQQQCAQVKIE